MSANTTRRRVARKPRCCPGCDRLIVPGETYLEHKSFPGSDSGGEAPLLSHAQRIADEAAALDYAETALDETWAVLRRIAEGAPDPARVAADLLEAHGHVLAARPAGDRAQPTQEPWRVGEHYGIHVYSGNQPIATFHRPEDAARAVAAVNGLLDAQAAVGRVEALLNRHADNLTPTQRAAFTRALTGTT